LRAGNGVIIKHAVPILLQKTFGHGIYADKKLDDPEKPVPNSCSRVVYSHIQYKYGGAYIQQHSVKSILLANFEQQVFFKQGPYLFEVVQVEFELFVAN
jgi:hypothetical protein